MENSQVFSEDFVSELSPNDDGMPGDHGPMGQDSPLLDDGPTGPYSSGERPPGFGSSSAPTSGAAPGKKTFRSLFAKKDKQQSEPTYQSKEKRPKAPRGQLGRRMSAADTIGDVWAGVGSLAIRSGHLPLGRYMQFSSAVSGELLDEAVKGSFVDKAVLQPIVKGRGRFDALGAVFGPPALIIAIERDPSKADVLLPLLKSSIRNALPMMVPAIKKVQEKEKKAAQAAAELFPDLPEGQDPVDNIIAMMFDGWTPPAPPAPPEESQQEPTEESFTNV